MVHPSSFLLLLACSAVLTQALPLARRGDGGLLHDQMKPSLFGATGQTNTGGQSAQDGNLVANALFNLPFNQRSPEQPATGGGVDSAQTSPAACKTATPPASCNGPTFNKSPSPGATADASGAAASQQDPATGTPAKSV